jgi:Na+/proline symporter
MHTATILTVLGVLVSGGRYLWLSWGLHLKTRGLDDLLPLTSSSSLAQVLTYKEFSAAMVAPTISLATVILAFAQLARPMGTWLLWTVATTAIGILAVRRAAPAIWKRLRISSSHHPTLHEYLGTSFGSPVLIKCAAVCTSLGFLSAFAVELTVGTRFLSTLAPDIPAGLGTILLACIGVAYTALGGFRVVVKTDQIQMKAIWWAIGALAVLISWQLISMGGISFVVHRMPPDVYDFSYRDDLIPFLIGVAVMNTFSYLADMSVWQRIAASRDERVVTRGLGGSIGSAAASWTALVLLMCALVPLVPDDGASNPLTTFLLTIGGSARVVLLGLFLIVVVGLYAASLSSASTQLIVTAHTLHTDILKGHQDRAALVAARHELVISRALLLIVATVSVAIVLALTAAGFTIADLVFSVYGAQLGLVPPVVLTLVGDRSVLSRLGIWASVAVLSGFFAGWGAAGVGKALGNSDIVFLSPGFSLVSSSLILAVGWAISGVRLKAVS